MIRVLHHRLRVDIDDRRTTFTTRRFEINRLSTHEDTAGNPIHLLLIGAAVLLAIKGGTQLQAAKLFVYGGSLFTAFLLFNAVLKWQPWNSRLHLPLFVLYAPLVGVVVPKTLGWRTSFVVGIVLLCAAIPWVFWNESRPLVGNKNIFTTDRIDQYFANKPQWQVGYVGAARFLASLKCANVGLVMRKNNWEYPLWVALRVTTWPMRIEHFNVNNISSRMPYPNGAFKPCAILSTRMSRESSLQLEKHPLAFVSGPIEVFPAR